VDWGVFASGGYFPFLGAALSMEVRCERCRTEYEFDEARIAESGTTVRCANCQHVFKLRKKTLVVTVPLKPGETDKTHAPLLRSQEGATPPPQVEKAPREWKVRQAGGNVFGFRELTTLQKWIVEKKVARDDEISLTGESWKRLGQIPELACFFEVVDKAGLVQPSTPADGAVPVPVSNGVSQPLPPIAAPAPKPPSAPHNILGAPVLAQEGLSPHPSAPVSFPNFVHSKNLDDLPSDDEFEPPRKGGLPAVLAALLVVAGAGYWGYTQYGNEVRQFISSFSSSPPEEAPPEPAAPPPSQVATPSPSPASPRPAQPAQPPASVPKAESTPEPPAVAKTPELPESPAKAAEEAPAKAPAATAAAGSAGEKPGAAEQGPTDAVPPAPDKEVAEAPSAEAAPAGAKAPPARPRNFEWYMGQGDKLRQRNKPGAALEAYRKAAEISPERSEPVAARGLALLDMGNRGAAEAAFVQALQMSPENGLALVGLAETYRVEGRREEALKYYEKYLEVVPNGPEAQAARLAIEQLQE
jgi:predicted Zn finger-like uncharacterized protein